MTTHPTSFESLYTITPTVFTDDRGYFTDSYNIDKLHELGISFTIDQISCAYNNKRGVLRGMHFQTEEFAQDKIVRCTKGKIFDVALDLRPESPTYGKWESLELSEGDNTLFLIPKGFAHGYQTLENDSVVEYLVQGKYAPQNSGGVRWNDPKFGISWPIANPFLSERDASWPLTVDLSLPQ